MRQVIVSGLLLVALALSGCTVSGQSPPTATHAGPTSGGVVVSSTPTTPHRATPPADSATRSPASDPITVVGIGDSVIAGTHCACAGPMAAYADLLSRATGRRASARGFGVNGATTGSVLTQVATDPVRTALRHAQIVIVIVGANDLAPDARRFSAGSCPAACYQPDVAAMGARLGQLLDRVRSLVTATRPTVLVAGYWDLFAEAGLARSGPDSDQLTWQEAITDTTNAEIRRQAQQHGDVYVDLVAPFRGPDGGDDPTRLLAADGDHPNAAGVRALARALVAAHPAAP